MNMNLAETQVAFNPEPTVERLRQAKFLLLWRIISMLISLAIALGFYYYKGQTWSSETTWWVFAIWGGTALFWITLSLIRLYRASQDLARINPEVPAIVFTPDYLDLLGRQIPWQEVSRVWAKPATSRTGHLLVVQTQDGDWLQLPFGALAASGGQIDSLLKIYGQPALDLDPLDQLV